MTRMTDAEVMALFQDGDSALNRARREFSGGCARIEQAHQQRMPPSPVETRRMEFEAVQKIAAALSPPEPTGGGYASKVGAILKAECGEQGDWTPADRAIHDLAVQADAEIAALRPVPLQDGSKS